MRARQRRMTAEIDLDGGREPAEIVAVALGHQERRLGEIHLACDVQHPGGVGWFWEDADRGGVPSERFVGERVDLRDAQGHARESTVEWCLVSGAWCPGRVGMGHGAVI